MNILSLTTTPKDVIIAQAAEVLAAGGLVVYPTETVYGIGADATNQQAVDKLLQYKARREGRPLSIAVANQAMAEEYVVLNEQAKQFYATFLPGPVTVVSESTNKVAKGVASERNTLGIRYSSYPLLRELVAAYGKPITATSANASYKKRPYTVSDILGNISAKQQGLIDLIIDAGELPKNDPSSVIDTTLEQPTVLRQGTIQLSDATTLTTKNEQETQDLGQKLITLYKSYLTERAVIFALVGEMGAGKTQLSKGIARGLGITSPVSSPTFTIAKEYHFNWGDDPYQFIHIDTWRLFSDDEFLALGFTQMLEKNAIISLEWADKISHTLKEYAAEAKIIWIKLEYGQTENERIITYSDQPLVSN
jgi:L-threonylcarbamoyladenylate synthase